jgi:N-acetylneuraminate synthase
VNFLKQWPNQISLMQCTTAYPTSPEQWGLQMISRLKNRYQLPVGFSDHSANVYAGLAAAALGADMLEFHVVFNHQMFGPDAKASLNIEQSAELVKGVRSINQSLASSFDKNEIQKYQDLKILFGKSVTTKNVVKKGDKIFFDDLETAKPGNKGIPAKDFQKIIGKTWATDLPIKHFVTENDFK